MEVGDLWRDVFYRWPAGREHSRWEPGRLRWASSVGVSVASSDGSSPPSRTAAHACEREEQIEALIA